MPKYWDVTELINSYCFFKDGLNEMGFFIFPCNWQCMAAKHTMAMLVTPRWAWRPQRFYPPLLLYHQRECQHCHSRLNPKIQKSSSTLWIFWPRLSLLPNIQWLVSADPGQIQSQQPQLYMHPFVRQNTSLPMSSQSSLHVAAKSCIWQVAVSLGSGRVISFTEFSFRRWIQQGQRYKPLLVSQWMQFDDCKMLPWLFFISSLESYNKWFLAF